MPTGYAGTIVDTIPVYIIPSQPTGSTTTKQYGSSATYEQIVGATCYGTDTPNWRTLRFSAVRRREHYASERTW